MDILLIGEGRNDIGRVGADGQISQPGAVTVLVGRVFRESHPGQDVLIRGIYWVDLRLASGSGFDRKLRLVPARREFKAGSAVVGVIDRDGAKNAARIRQLAAGREFLQADGHACAVGLAIETLEAWLLSDEGAIQRALDDSTISRSKDPESIRDPKVKLRGLIASAPNVPAPGDYTALYAAIALNIKLEVLEQRCPKGFTPFADQIGQL